jgi:hypothetical protein
VTAGTAWAAHPHGHVARWAPSRVPLVAVAVAVGVGIATTYLAWAPPTPDYAAQTAWATLVHQAGDVPVYGRWFSGVNVGSYSLLVPALTGALSVRVVGAASAVVALLGVVPLLRQSHRPRLALTVFAICVAANLLSGRVTFAVGVALGVGVLVVVARGWVIGAALIAILSYAASPVAGVLLLVPLGAIAINDRSLRAASAAAVGGVLGAAALSRWLFPLSGYEPFNRELMLTGVAIQLGVAAAPVSRRMRLAAVLGALLVVATYLLHTPLGGNVARLPVLLMPAAAAAEFATRRTIAHALTAMLLIYPIVQAAGDVAAAGGRSAQPGFATGLEHQLAADPTARTHRIEVVDAASHWGSVRLSDAGYTVARGWLTQVDEVQNPEFYTKAALTATTYRAFLDRTSCGFVAVEHAAPLDSASTSEASLITRGLPYLTEVWSDSDWTLYEVIDPNPVATGNGHVLRMTDTGLILAAEKPGRVGLNLSWSRYLTITGGTISRHGPDVIATVTSAGQHTVAAHWP